MNDKAAVEAVIQTYFDAAFVGDGEKMATVFHEAAHIYGLDEKGALINWAAPFFTNLVTSLAAATTQSMGLARRDIIHSLDFTGADTAVARVSLRVRDTLFTGILSFIKIGGTWKIIAKVLAGVPA